jgi:hypothetical protein
MSSRKRKSAALHAPLPSGVKRLGQKFARNRYQSDTFGTPELCTWRVGGGVCRFQTRCPNLAKKLSQRRGASLVAWSVHGGYFRIFDEVIEPWRARRLVRRYATATNGAFFDAKRPTARRNPQGSTTIAAIAGDAK